MMKGRVSFGWGRFRHGSFSTKSNLHGLLETFNLGLVYLRDGKHHDEEGQQQGHEVSIGDQPSIRSSRILGPLMPLFIQCFQVVCFFGAHAALPMSARGADFSVSWGGGVRVFGK